MNNVLKDLKDIGEKVEKLLILFPKTRDNDNLLVSYYWAYQLGDKFENLTCKDFFRIYAEGKEVICADTITRARRKVQEKCPALRGNKYSHRKNNETIVRTHITDLHLLKFDEI